MVNKNRLFDEFSRLVRFDSESYEERHIADYLKNKLQELGLIVTEDDAGEKLKDISGKDKSKRAGNIYGYLKGNSKGESVLLSAHMDTVSPGNGKRAVFHDDGKISSDGNTVLGADDVSGIVSILEALAIIKENSLRHADIEILFLVAEEPYAQGSRIFDYSVIKAKKAYVFDLSGRVGTAAISAPSIVSFKIDVIGKSAHAGFCPEEGIHAILIAAKAISELPSGRVDADTTVNIGTIVGGVQRNIVPERCVIFGEIRSAVHEKALDHIEIIKKVFREKATLLGGEVEVSYVEELRAYRIGLDEDVIQHYTEVCKILGLDTEFIDTYGGSDNNNFTANGIRGIVLANAMNDVHTKFEYTTKKELIKSAELALQLVID